MQAEGFSWLRHYAHAPVFRTSSRAARPDGIFSLNPLRSSCLAAQHSHRFIQKSHTHEEMAEMAAAYSCQRSLEFWDLVEEFFRSKGLLAREILQDHEGRQDQRGIT